MELSFYDARGSPTAYCEDGRILYSFNGTPLAYLDGDSVYGFKGGHLGWWSRGWVIDHQGSWVFSTELAAGGPPLPRRRASAVKRYKKLPPAPAAKHMKPVPTTGGLGWSSRSGPQFFEGAH